KIRKPQYFLYYIERQYPPLSGVLTTVFDKDLLKSSISQDFINETKKTAQEFIQDVKLLTIKPIVPYKNQLKFFLILLVNTILIYYIPIMLNKKDSVIVDSATGELSIEIFNLEATVTPPKYLQKESYIIKDFDGFIKLYTGSTVNISGKIAIDAKKCSVQYVDQISPCETKNGEFSASIVVLKTGSYNFSFENDKEVFKSTSLKFDIIPDESPTVSIIFPEKDLTLNTKDKLEVSIMAKDDISVSKLLLKYSILDVEESLKEIEIDIEPSILVNESYLFDLSAFEPGDVITYFAEVFDNDETLGPKSTVSKSLKIEIPSPIKKHEEFLEQLKMITDSLGITLANILEIPPKKTVKEIISLKNSYLKTIPPQITLLRKLLLAENPLLAEGSKKTIQNITDNLEAQTEKELAFPNKNLSIMIKLLEESILYFVDILDRERLEIIQELYKELKDKKDYLKKLVNQYKNNRDEKIKKEIYSEIKKLEKKIHAILEKLSKLSNDIDSEFINQEASKLKKMKEEMESLEDLLNNGELDKLLERIDQLDKELDDLLEGVSDKKSGLMDERQSEAEKMRNKMMNQLQDLIFEEEQIFKDTQKLSSKVLDHVKKHKKEIDDKIELLEEAYNQLFNVKKSIMNAYDKAHLENGLDELSMAIESIKAGDPSSGYQILLTVIDRIVNIKEGIKSMLRWGVNNPKEHVGNKELLDSAEKKIKEFLNFWDKLQKDASKQFSKEELKKMEELSKHQSELRKKLDKLREMASKQNIAEGDSSEKLDGIDKNFKNASDELGEGVPKQAQLSEEGALQKLKEMQQDMQKQNQSNQNKNSSRQEKEKFVKIPSEKGKGPKELREDILKSMKKTAPEGYKNVVDDYFKNIIK
ncbi:hypothetical protein JXR93_10715, partial [bacterium]|nr:hypothetical protein [bacterium]